MIGWWAWLGINSKATVGLDDPKSQFAVRRLRPAPCIIYIRDLYWYSPIVADGLVVKTSASDAAGAEFDSRYCQFLLFIGAEPK